MNTFAELFIKEKNLFKLFKELNFINASTLYVETKINNF